MDAIAQLKNAHTTVDSVSVTNLIEALYDLKLVPNENPTDVINKVRVVHGKLLSVGKKLDDDMLVAAVVKCLRQNPTWAAAIRTMQSVANPNITMQSLGRTFYVVANPDIPGAMFASHAKPDEVYNK